jgi:hypothetical protein
LFVTVHNRRPSRDAAQHVEWNRAAMLINAWVKDGPFKYGDFRLVLPFEREWTDSWGAMDPSRDYIYGSLPQGYLRLAYALQYVHHKLRGGRSYALMVLHNQAVVWLSSALVAFLVYLVSRDMGLGAHAAFLLGFACQSVYQTFPWNLQMYWAISPYSVATLALAWILVSVYRCCAARAIPAPAPSRSESPCS